MVRLNSIATAVESWERSGEAYFMINFASYMLVAFVTINGVQFLIMLFSDTL